MQPNLKKFATDPLAFIESLLIPSGRGVKRFSECMAPFQRAFFQQLSPILVSVAYGTEPAQNRVWLERSKGGSKDSDIACCFLWCMAFAQQPVRGRIAASDREQASEVWLIIKGLLRCNPWLSDRIQLQNSKILCKATDSECDVISADAQSTHGGRISISFLNELCHHPAEDFAQTVADDASKMPFGVMIVATNAGVVNTWQHAWRKNAEENPEQWLMSVMSEPAPWLNARDIEDARRRNPKDRFRRLWYGEWSSGSSSCLEEDDILFSLNYNLHSVNSTPPNWITVAALDLGLANDHSALCVVGINRSTQRFRLFYAHDWKPDPVTGKVDLMAVERECLEVNKRYRPVVFSYDAWQAALLAQRLELQRVPMKEMVFSSKNLTLMAQTLVECFRNRRIEIFNEPKLISDLRRLQIEERPFGIRITATRDSEGHADLATALIIALPFCVEESGKVPVVAGAITASFDNDTPYERELKRLAKQSEFEAREMSRYNGVREEDEWFVDLMRAMGRRA